MDLANLRRPDRRGNAVVGGVVLLGLLALGAVLVLRAPGMGWDEAVYASKARSLATDVPASAWNLFRPPGLAYLGVLAAPFGFFDESLRLLSMTFAVLGLAAFGILGAFIGGRVAAVIAVIVAATIPIVLAELPLFHNDLPSAGVLFALMALLWHQLEVRPSPDGRLLLAPLLAAAAFYLRFGSLAAILAIGLVMLALWWRVLVRAWRTSLAALGVGVALAIPHVLLAARETGSPFGILSISVDKVNTTGPLTAALAYLRGLSGSIAGPLGIVFLLAGAILGLMVLVRLVRRGSRPPEAAREDRAAAWLLVPASLTAVALLLVSHAEARYLLFPALSFLLAGAIATTRGAAAVLARGRSREVADRLSLTAFAALIVIVGAVTVRNAATRPSAAPDEAGWVAETGAWIREHKPGGPCLVVSTLYPILGWYSACASDEFMIAPKRLLPDELPPGATYLVFTSYDGHRRKPDTLARYRAVATDPIATVGTADRGAEITLLRAP